MRVRGRKVIVVGAGLGGLNSARILQAAGVDVTLIEASDGVGGRVRSDRTADGFTLDRGFQVLFTAYPSLRRAVGLESLHLRRFDSGAAVVGMDGVRYLWPPLKHPARILNALASPLLTWNDRLALIREGARLVGQRWDGVRDVAGGGGSTRDFLHARGYSARFVEGFLRPFWGGILLRSDLSTNADVFRFTLRMLIVGQAALPAAGMQALPDALARRLPAGSIFLNEPATALIKNEGGQVVGVRTTKGTHLADAVVSAADGRSGERLSGIPLPHADLGCATLYFAGTNRLYPHKVIALNATNRGVVNEAALLTNVAPEYAPPGWHLLSATVLDPDLDDERLEHSVRADLTAWFPGRAIADWRTIRVQRIPHAQFAQPPGIYQKLPEARSEQSGLYLAGEVTQDSSINGALKGGEDAAQAVIADLAHGDLLKKV